MSKQKWVALFLCLAVLGQASAQFVPGQVLNASALNAALAGPNITGGTINGAPIGNFNPNTGVFTSLLVNSGSSGAQFRMAQLTAPTCTTNCGSTPTVTGTDTAMIITMGATGTPASGWVIRFNGTWTAVPACVAIAAKSGMAAGKAPIVASPTTTSVTITTNGTAPANSDRYAVQCLGVS